MGTAILEGAFRKAVCIPSQVWVADKMQEKVRAFCKKNRCQAAQDAIEIARKTDVILLAVKPQDLAETAAAITQPGKILIGTTPPAVTKSAIDQDLDY